MFELSSLRANLHGITDVLLDEVVALVDAQRQHGLVARGAALVCWRLCEHDEARAARARALSRG